MELSDSVFPLLNKVTTETNYKGGFENTDYALLVGAMPRGPGMER